MTRGGFREGSGRPKKEESEKKMRPQNQLRAFPDEWELIKQFAKIVKENPEKAKKMLEADII